MKATEEQIEMYSFYSDTYKDVHNIRPRWHRPEDHTPEEWRAMIDELIQESREIARREEEEDETGPDPLSAWYDTSAELE